MSITSAIVMFAVLWAMIFYIVLPLGIRTQADEGRMVEGSAGGAPLNPRIGRKALWTTLWAVLAYLVIYPAIQWGGISITDISVLTPPSARGG